MSGQDPFQKGEKKDTRIKPGEVRNPKGRPKGARSKLGHAFLEAMHDDFVKHGVNVIQAVRLEKPEQYLKVVASVLPKEIDASEELIDTINQITRRVVDAGSG